MLVGRRKISREPRAAVYKKPKGRHRGIEAILHVPGEQKPKQGPTAVRRQVCGEHNALSWLLGRRNAWCVGSEARAVGSRATERTGLAKRRLLGRATCRQ